LNFYKRHLGDYAKDTAHLSMLEHGAYTVLLDRYYTTEQPIAQTEAYRVCRARSREEKAAVDAVLGEFFDLAEGVWRNKRCDEEIARANAQAETNRKIAADREARKLARKGNDSFTGSDNDSLASPDNDSLRVREPSQTPDTRHQTPRQAEEPIPDLLSQVPALRPEDRPDERPQLTLVEPPPPKPKGPPDCPHAEVLALWQEVLPQLPQHLASQWRGTRADHLRARWRETAVEKGWTDQQQGLAYLRKLFGYVGRSEFLTGRARPVQGQRPFVIELEWLVNPSNWAKVHEGKYHPETA
jgi:uncharacterized protein YdaU (DUF1376 family)